MLFRTKNECFHICKLQIYSRKFVKSIKDRKHRCLSAWPLANWAVFTKLYFLRNLQMGPIRYSVCSYKTYSLFFCLRVKLELTLKWSTWKILHSRVGSLYTNKLQTWLNKSARNKHFSLLAPIVSYEENKLLWIRSLKCIFILFTQILLCNSI